MKIQIWNAFASNNSGSYTIVGGSLDAEVLSRAVELLKPVLIAHDEWHQNREARPIIESPLARFAVAQGIPVGTVDEEWPFYGDDSNVPQVVALGGQVLIHHSYTTGLPRFFGYWIYALGGRVATEFSHAHDPLITLCDGWFPWNTVTGEARAHANEKLLKALSDPQAGYRTWLQDPLMVKIFPAAEWACVRLAAIFSDIPAGCAAVRALMTEQGALMQVEIQKSDDHENPLGRIKEADE